MARSRNIGKIGKVSGLDDLVGELQALEKRIVKGGVDKALRAASKPVVGAIRQEVPVETGSLKKSIGLKLRTYKRRNSRVSIIGARSKAYQTDKGKRNPAKYAHFVEFGVKPHIVRKRNRGRKDGRMRVIQNHPGHDGTGAFRRGFEAGEGRAAAELVRVLREVVESNRPVTSSPSSDED